MIIPYLIIKVNSKILKISFIFLFQCVDRIIFSLPPLIEIFSPFIQTKLFYFILTYETL